MHEGRKEERSEEADGAVTAALVFARSPSLSFLAFSLSLLLSLIIICLLLVAAAVAASACRHTGNDLSRRLDTHATAAASSPDQTAVGELLVGVRLLP